MFVHVWYCKGQRCVSVHRLGKGTHKLGYTWQPMITSDHRNQDMTNMRNSNRKGDIPLYHQEGQIGWSRGCWPKTKDNSSCHGKSSEQEYTDIFKGSLVLLGTSPRPKMKGKESKPDWIEDYLPPPRGERGRRGIKLWWWRDGGNPGHEGHDNKYHIIIRVIRWKECGGQPELGQEEKAGVGRAGRHPDSFYVTKSLWT